jgi:hypothetical protein
MSQIIDTINRERILENVTKNEVNYCFFNIQKRY